MTRWQFIRRAPKSWSRCERCPVLESREHGCGFGAYAAPDSERFRGLLDQHPPALKRPGAAGVARPLDERRICLAVGEVVANCLDTQNAGTELRDRTAQAR